MHHLIENIELYLFYLVEICIIVLELFGVAILIITAIKCFFKWFKSDHGLRLELAHGIALALEFKLGSEVLRTVVVRKWEELAILGAIILLRGLLTFLIHWEIKHEEAAIEKKKS